MYIQRLCWLSQAHTEGIHVATVASEEKRHIFGTVVSLFKCKYYAVQSLDLHNVTRNICRSSISTNLISFRTAINWCFKMHHTYHGQKGFLPPNKIPLLAKQSCDNSKSKLGFVALSWRVSRSHSQFLLISESFSSLLWLFRYQHAFFFPLSHLLIASLCLELLQHYYSLCRQLKSQITRERYPHFHCNKSLPFLNQLHGFRYWMGKISSLHFRTFGLAVF